MTTLTPSGDQPKVARHKPEYAGWAVEPMRMMRDFNQQSPIFQQQPPLLLILASVRKVRPGLNMHFKCDN